MAGWLEKYGPLSGGAPLRDAEFHTGTNARLERLAHTPDVPHLLFYGPAGAGKRTRILGFLIEMFGREVLNVKVAQKTFRPSQGAGKRGKELAISTLFSNYHIEINPSDVGQNDRHVLQEVFLEIAETASVRPVNHATSSSCKLPCPSMKVVVINEADRLSREGQNALRRTMEKYMTQCRVILCCESLTHVIDPIQSRCELIRVPAPSHGQIQTMLEGIAQQERLGLDAATAQAIAVESNRDLRRAVLLLETWRADTFHSTDHRTGESKDGSFSGAVGSTSDEKKATGQPTPVRKSDWEEALDGVAAMAVQEQSPVQLNLCCEKLHEVVGHGIPPDLALKSLRDSLINRCINQEDVARSLAVAAAEYDHRMSLGSKPVLHLESLLAKFMALYTRSLTTSLDQPRSTQS